MPIAQNKYPPQNHSAFLALAEEMERVKKMEGGTAFIVDLIEAVVESQGLVVVDKAEYESLSPGKVEGWREIESAPKDGTHVDLWSPRLGRMANFHWQKYSEFRDRPSFECWSGPGGFGPLASQYPADRCPDAQPTHWMPIPSPPISSRAEDS